MNERPTDYHDARALDIVADVMSARFTIAELRTLIALQLRQERARGHAEGLTASLSRRPTLADVSRTRTPADDVRLRDLAARLGQQVRAPRELRSMERAAVVDSLFREDEQDGTELTALEQIWGGA
jgi:hypothetical protein